MSYTIRTDRGIVLNYSPRKYDTACRVAHYLRENNDSDFYVISPDTGRAMSEVFNVDTQKDNYAKGVARRLSG